MPGGPSNPQPPSMRLKRQSGPDGAAWVEAHPVGRCGAGILVLALLSVFVLGGTFPALSALFERLGAPRPAGAIEQLTVGVVLAAEFALLLLLLRPVFTLLRVVTDPATQTVTLHRSWLGAPRPPEVFSPKEVTHVVLIEKVQVRDCLELRLLLAGGETRFIDHGQELRAMTELAYEVQAALGRPLLRFDQRQADLFGARFARVELDDGSVAWLDLAERRRRAGLWGVCVGTAAGTALLAVAWVWVVETLRDPATRGQITTFGLIWLGFITLGVTGLCAASVWVLFHIRRVAGLVLSMPGRSVTVRRKRFLRAWTEVLTSGEVAAVVRWLGRKGRCCRVGLEYHDGRQELLERSSLDPSPLPRFAEELAETLGVPVRDERLGVLFW